MNNSQKITKKASISMIQLLILIGISLIILLAFEAPLLAKLLSSQKQENCEATVAVHKATKFFYDLTDSPTPINCPRTQISFYENHMEIDQKAASIVVTENNKKKLITKYDTVNEQIINPILAEEMRKCWQNFGQGEGDTPFNRNFIKQKHVCAVCSQIEFKAAPVNYNIDSLNNYVLKTKIPFADKTYKEYLNKENILKTGNINGNQIAKITDNSLKLYDFPFVQNDDYYVMVMNKVPSPTGTIVEKVANAVSITQVKEDQFDGFYILLINQQQFDQNFADCNELIG